VKYRTALDKSYSCFDEGPVGIQIQKTCNELWERVTVTVRDVEPAQVDLELQLANSSGSWLLACTHIDSLLTI
jgi:hypothetical protein